ncbi:MAG: RluA family pseudouridine synthase [Syntrophobacterales bacterium]|nr:RluA family pseudouridine synthase [Syntrophobacterales bacterium]
MMVANTKGEEIREFKIKDEDQVGKRLDLFLVSVLEGYSRGGIQSLIEAGDVTVNGLYRKPGYRLRLGDLVACRIVSPKPLPFSVIEPVPMPLDILYEDPWIIVLNKPPGLVVHPGAGQTGSTLVHALLYHCNSLASIGAPLRPGIVHRLDQGTSGVMVVAKTNEAYLNLIEQFKSHKVEKTYLAIVCGVPGKKGNVPSPIVTLIDRHPVNRKKMAVSKSKGREAVTYWRVLRDWVEVSLVEAKPITGRTHQIRVHLSYIDHPIVGDELYGNTRNRCKNIKDETLKLEIIKITHQMLHALSISFNHPYSGKRLHFEASLPKDMENLIALLEGYI